jgi:translation initiation factor IF-2
LTEEEEKKAQASAKKERRSHLSMRDLLAQVVGEDDEEVMLDAPAPEADTAQRRTFTPAPALRRREVRRRKDLKNTQITMPRASYRVVKMASTTITVGDLAHQLSIKAADIIKKLMGQGVMATINQPLDADTATLISSEYGFEVKNVALSADDILGRKAADPSALETRPPIVTIMGHVDHGKTSILDALRSANVAAGEAGGITQHIGAYTVDYQGKRIAFLDTPGHEAFSAMRSRGAKVTDIIVLVVAADDGVMPQTIEAISHAKAANVPVVVAVNKIDKHGINFDRIFNELAEHGIQSEEWGGENQFVKVSALKRLGLEELMDAILLQAEVLDLKSSSTAAARGVVVEAHLDKGRGPVATVMVTEGILKKGDQMIAGTAFGRIRAMIDWHGKQLDAAGPSTPVEIIGLESVPMAGDQVDFVEDEKSGREVISHRQEIVRNEAQAKSNGATLEDLLAKVANQEAPEVPFIIKADTQGSAEAIAESMLKIKSEKIKAKIVHRAVGGINASDVSLAETSGAVIFGFNARAPRDLQDAAEKRGVIIKYFSIIYELLDTTKSIMAGQLPPVRKEVVTGHAEVRNPISVPKIGMIAGSFVTSGKIVRSASLRIIRDNVVIHAGRIGSLRRFKDDVKEVATGYECGIGVESFNDLRIGDVIEAFQIEETAAEL